jgi:hypothetical protein
MPVRVASSTGDCVPWKAETCGDGAEEGDPVAVTSVLDDAVVGTGEPVGASRPGSAEVVADPHAVAKIPMAMQNPASRLSVRSFRRSVDDESPGYGRPSRR